MVIIKRFSEQFSHFKRATHQQIAHKYFTYEEEMCKIQQVNETMPEAMSGSSPQLQK